MKKKVYLTYPSTQIKEPLIYDVGRLFKVKTNIRQATISETVGLVALELEGESSAIDEAVEFFTEKGVTVEPIELDVIE